MKIVTNAKSVFGLSLIVPIDGRIEIDSDGYAEVSEECAEVLVKGTSDWQYVEEDAVNDEEDAEDEETTEDTEEESEDAKIAELKSNLEDMTFDGVKQTASELGLPEKEWKKFGTKKSLIAYIVAKYKTL